MSAGTFLLPTIFKVPRFRWQSDGTVEITHCEKNDAVVIHAIAVNDHCVVSNSWKKKCKY